MTNNTQSYFRSLGYRGHRIKRGYIYNSKTLVGISRVWQTKPLSMLRINTREKDIRTNTHIHRAHMWKNKECNTLYREDSSIRTMGAAGAKTRTIPRLPIYVTRISRPFVPHRKIIVDVATFHQSPDFVVSHYTRSNIITL